MPGFLHDSLCGTSTRGVALPNICPGLMTTLPRSWLGLWCSSAGQAEEYVVAGVVSALIALPLFAVFQATGPWVYYGYKPFIDQANYMETLSKLKATGPFVPDINYSDGLICFPSFHTVLAILAARVLWSVPYIKLPAATLALLIVISTVTTGSHYVVDVVAGVGVAWLSILAANAYTQVENRIRTSPSVGAATDERTP
jgi:membrane-associated phospholipid phosphatase